MSINALATITPSAFPRSERTCWGLEIPKPTTRGVEVTPRTLAKKSGNDGLRSVRLPVTSNAVELMCDEVVQVELALAERLLRTRCLIVKNHMKNLF